jgi:type I restriction enzyme, S subunit
MSLNTNQLGNVAEIISGFAFKSDWFQSVGTSVIRIGDICDEEINASNCVAIDENIHKVPESCRAKEGDILMALSGATTGKIGVVKTSSYGSLVNQRIAIIRSPELITQRYLKYIFTGHLLRRLLNQAWGAAQPNLSPQALRELEIPLPPLEEQRRIAAILDKADEVRRKRQQAIALTEELLRSLFLDMFGDPVTNPKGWEVVELGKTFERNPQIGTTKPAHSDGKQLVVRVGEIGNQNVNLDKCGQITLEGKDLERFLCNSGDLLLARAIGSESHLGKASILQDTTQVVVFDSHVMRLRFISHKLLPVFFLQWLKTKGGRTRFMQEAGRTAVQFNVNAQQISRVKIPLPPIQLQEQFAKFYEKNFMCVEKYTNGQQAKNTLFNSLLQKAFRGEL